MPPRTYIQGLSFVRKSWRSLHVRGVNARGTATTASTYTTSRRGLTSKKKLSRVVLMGSRRLLPRAVRESQRFLSLCPAAESPWISWPLKPLSACRLCTPALGSVHARNVAQKGRPVPTAFQIQMGCASADRHGMLETRLQKAGRNPSLPSSWDLTVQ